MNSSNLPLFQPLGTYRPIRTRRNRNRFPEIYNIIDNTSNINYTTYTNNSNTSYYNTNNNANNFYNDQLKNKS